METSSRDVSSEETNSEIHQARRRSPHPGYGYCSEGTMKHSTAIRFSLVMIVSIGHASRLSAAAPLDAFDDAVAFSGGADEVERRRGARVLDH